MNKKIDIYINNRYWASTNRHKRCKDAISSISRQVYNSCAGKESILVSKDDKVTAHFSKGVR